jgi:hypothetical protein
MLGWSAPAAVVRCGYPTGNRLRRRTPGQGPGRDPEVARGVDLLELLCESV